MRPNVLFFYPDQLRFDWIETRGAAPVRTPNLKRLADEGVEFTRAVTPSPVCAPARACLAAGKEYDRCRVAGNHENYPLDQTTFYTLLRDSCYHVMGCGKFDLHKPDHDWGVDGKRLLAEWGFSDGVDNEGKMDAVTSYRNNGKPMGPYIAFLKREGLLEAHVDDYTGRGGHGTDPCPLPEEAYCDNWLCQNGLDLIRGVPGGKPWFLQVNCTGPHLPFDVTNRMAERWRGVDHPQPYGGEDLTPDHYGRCRQNYSAMVENIDRWVGIYVGELEKRGELDNTLFVFSSDHGEMLGDHNRFGKGRPHHPSVSVPMVVWGPGVRAGVVCDEPATNLDLTATFLDYAGLHVLGDMDSRSFRPLLEGRTQTHRHYVLSGLKNWRLAYDGQFKYVRNLGGRAQLFDMETDPFEADDIIDERPDVAERLSRILDEEGVLQDGPRTPHY